MSIIYHRYMKKLEQYEFGFIYIVGASSYMGPTIINIIIIMIIKLSQEHQGAGPNKTPGFSASSPAGEHHLRFHMMMIDCDDDGDPEYDDGIHHIWRAPSQVIWWSWRWLIVIFVADIVSVTVLIVMWKKIYHKFCSMWQIYNALQIHLFIRLFPQPQERTQYWKLPGVPWVQSHHIDSSHMFEKIERKRRMKETTAKEKRPKRRQNGEKSRRE